MSPEPLGADLAACARKVADGLTAVYRDAGAPRPWKPAFNHEKGIWHPNNRDAERFGDFTTLLTRFYLASAPDEDGKKFAAVYNEAMTLFVGENKLIPEPK
jgi:hypothetical protein